VLGVAVCSYFERHYYGDYERKASWKAYILLCICLLVSSATSNIALSYINYPTKVVFRSCKLIPTMLIAVSYNHKKVAWYEFVFGSTISLGMVLFAAADFQVSPNFNFIGKLLLLVVSLLSVMFLFHLSPCLNCCFCSRRYNTCMYKCCC
jgi:adenosine 3'-phospho 5'-phosphosulfate transporter B3